ncbi:MAG TPA: VanZ family protein [Paucimonas sp.]|nr:VanZ family protein [Paucimonas sp.]
MPPPRNRNGSAGSPTARVGWLLYTLLIVYASWYPFSGWYDLGLSPFAFLSAPMPHYWTRFDVLTNVAGYVPFGLLTVFALYPKLRGAAAWIVAALAGALLSGMMEMVQTYLPSRVSSNLDLFANAGGAALGALLGVALTRIFLEESRLLLLRRAWFTREAGRGLVVVALWPLAQLYPQGYLFGLGQFMPTLSAWLSELLDADIDIGAMLRHAKQLTVEQYWLSEAMITASGLTGAVLTLLCLTRERAPRAILAVLLFGAALLAKSLASALHFSPDNAFFWLTPGAEGGLLCGFVMIVGLVFAPPVAQRRVAVLTLLISLAVVNIAPPNPYFASTLQTWLQGKFLNFNGAAQFLALLWPFATLWFLLHPVHRDAHRRPENE